MSITQAQDRLEVLDDDPTADRDTSPEVVSTPIGVRPTFTITEAAAACAVSRKTITRKLVDLAGHGAAKDDDGIWRIPVEALLAIGLHPGRSVPSDSGSSAPRPAGQAPHGEAPRAPAAGPRVGFVPAGPDMVSIPRDRWDDLRIRLARAEAEAAERALALADARLALRALTAGPAAPAGPSPSAVQDPVGTIPIAPAPAAPARTGAGGDVEPAPVQVEAPSLDLPMDEIASARSHAARTGGYVPAAGAPQGRKRRWWQSKQ